MRDVAVRVDQLSKRYRIGQPAQYRDLRESLSHAVRAPIRMWQRARHRGVLEFDAQESNIWALKDICLAVKQGDVLGIIGQNGAGKTTLLKILSRITEPTSGRIEICGRVGSLLEVGTGFHPELTGRENIYLNGAILGMRKSDIEARFDEIVAFAEVEKFIDTPVKRYSSGMYVRLAFAVAAHMEPDILLVDEVLAVGDAAFQAKCLGKIGELAGGGRTVLFVSHNMTAIGSLCRRAVWLDRGVIQEDSSVEMSISAYMKSVREYHKVTQGTVNLHGHPGRRKHFDGVVNLVECQLLDQEYKPTSYFKSGSHVRIRLNYRAKAQMSGKGIVFVCVFRNIKRQRIAYCSSDVSGDDLSKLETTSIVECQIPRLPLTPGTYSIDVGCKVSNGWSDFVYEAVEFDVLDGGFYPTRLLPPAGEGNLLLEYTWEKV